MPHDIVARRAPLDQPTAWAVHPDVMPRIAEMMRCGISVDALSAEQLEQHRPQAAVRGGPRVAGAVAVLSLRGLITPRPSLFSLIFGGGGGGLEFFRELFRDAVGSDDIGAILLDIDSPGGSAALVTETAREIRAARGTKPIVAIANTMAASAAYYLASQADEVVVSPSGLIGSIGVYSVHEDWSKFNEDFGVKPTYISAGRFKTDGNMDEPLSDTARAALQETVDDFYDLFVADVAAGRGVSDKDVRDGYGEGRVITAQRAVDMNLADRVGTIEEVIQGLVGGGGGAAATAALSRRADAVPAAPVAATEQPAPEATAPAPEPVTVGVDGGDPDDTAAAVVPAEPTEPAAPTVPATELSDQDRDPIASVLLA